jgi:hypothetical protein
MRTAAQPLAVVLVSASESSETARRALAARGLRPLTATSTLTSLRRSLVRQKSGPVTIMCVTLDDPTLRRHARSLASLLADRDSFARPIHVIGLMCDGVDAAQRWAAIGCDAWAADLAEVERLIDVFSAMHGAACPGSTLWRRGATLLSPKRADTRALDLR